MTDFYVMLGLTRTATPDEIRCAYLERMKVLHPDRHAPPRDGAPSAADLNHAYWILRDRDRRAAYDLTLVPRQPRPRRRGRQPGRELQLVRERRLPKKKPYYPRRSSYSRRARALAAVVLVLVSAGAGAGTMMLWRNHQAQAASARLAVELAGAKAAQRRVLDETLAGAASAEFQAILDGAGFSGASLYGRQCFDELAAHPNAAMVDYCLAFDRTGAEWEGTLVTRRDARRYFDAHARLGRYRQLVESMRDGEVREAIAAAAAFLNGS